MNNKNVVIGVLVVLLGVASGFFLFSGKKEAPVEENVSAAAGLPHYQVESFLTGLTAGQRQQFSVNAGGLMTQGAPVYSTTTSGTVNLTAAQVINYGTIVFTPTITGATLKLPTKAELIAADPTFLQNKGDRTQRMVLSSTSTPAATFVISGNTGVHVQHASTTATPTVYQNRSVLLTIMRSPTSTDFYVTAQY